MSNYATLRHDDEEIDMNIFNDTGAGAGAEESTFENKRSKGEAITLQLFDQEEGQGGSGSGSGQSSSINSPSPQSNQDQQQLLDRVEKLEKDQEESSKKINDVLSRLNDANQRFDLLYERCNRLERERDRDRDRDNSRLNLNESLTSRSSVHEEGGPLDNIITKQPSTSFEFDNNRSRSGNGEPNNSIPRTIGLSQDTYTLMKTTAICTSSWSFGFIVNCVQQLLIFLIFLQQVGLSLNANATPFGINYKVDPYTQIAQFIAVMVALAMSKDLFNPIIIDLPNLWFTKTEQWLKVANLSQNTAPNCWTWFVRIFLPSLMQFVTGTMAFLVSFIIILQGDTIVTIFVEIVTIFAIAQMDNIGFWCAKEGYIGDRAMNDAIDAKNTRVEDVSQKCCCGIQLRPFVFLSLLFIMVGSLIPVILRQTNGVYFRMMYPQCNLQHSHQILQINDGKCDGGVVNSYECGFDGGDCVQFNIAFPSCNAENPALVGDGVCNAMYNISDCGFDGGDCCNGDKKYLGDGVCHLGLNTPNCLYDHGDCDSLQNAYPLCPVSTDVALTDENGQPIVLGDGLCNHGKQNITAYMNEQCGYVFGDCKDIRVKDIELREKYPDCIGVTDFFRIGDGVCDGGAYLTEECGYEELDCCNLDHRYVGDGICDSGDQNSWRSLDGTFLNKECGYEGLDCCPSFAKPLIGNGVCADDFQITDNRPPEKVSFNAVCGWDGSDCTVAGYPDCNVADPRLIGDGRCNGGDYNTEECGYDGRDCILFNKKYPNCEAIDPFKLGDGKCDDMADQGSNTPECGYDDLDCLTFNAKYPNCAVSAPYKLGDGVCFVEYNNAECGFDGGDCIGQKSEFNLNYPSCNVTDPSEINNGVCNAKGSNGDYFNSRICGYDGGDCIGFMVKYPGCTVDNPLSVGNGHCDKDSNTLECDYDGGDCIEFNEKYPYCDVPDPENLSNGLCNGKDYNTPECDFDGGDCKMFNERYPNCEADFPGEIGDGKCTHKYNTASCGYDGGDCEEWTKKYPDCLADNTALIGNGICNNYFPYNTRQCDYDGGDCRGFNELYPECNAKYHSAIGNGICNNYDPYNTLECAYDGGDCTEWNDRYPLCKARNTDEIGNGHCDGKHNIIECDYDGGDCKIFNDMYPGCDVWDPSAIGDGKCNKSDSYNNEECGWDGGDCILHVLYPDCDPSLINKLEDGFCHGDANTLECLYDGGDCETFNSMYPDCKVSHPEAVGDGFCHGSYNTLECLYDGGDCDHFNQKYPNCRTNTPSSIGDGFCNIFFNTTQCGFDGGDCL